MSELSLEEKREWCKTCTNRKVDYSQGLLCNLTNAIPDFDKVCPSYNKEEKQTVPSDNQHISMQLSREQEEKLLAEQNFNFAIIAGLIASIIGALIWAVVTVSTGYQIGFMALGVGALVGIAVRVAGKGIEAKYGIIGGFFALLGCLMGNLFSTIGFVADYANLGVIEVFNIIPLSSIPSLMTETFSLMDLVFYGIAVYEGYRFAFRQIEPELLADTPS